MRRISAIATVVMALCVAAATVHAEKFDLEVYASKFDSIPIGVIDFKVKGGEGKGESAPSSIIFNDLDLSGRFHVVRLASYDSVSFANQSAGIYIDGELTTNGPEIVLDCYLRDAATRELIIGKKYRGEPKYLRTMVHRYCNEIVEMLFGDRGIFESRLLYVQTEGANKNIAVMDFDGYDKHSLTNNKVINIFPTFVSDSTMLFVSYLRGKPDIYRGSALSGKSKAFIYSRYVQSSPDVSPVDGTIAYACSQAGNLDIYTCNADGTNVRALTVSRSIDTSPTWSPNGYQIAFTSDRSGNPEIYVMDADGANQRRITYKGTYHDSPAWSPKGDKIVFQQMGDNSKFDIWSIAPDGSGAKQLTALSGNNEYPTWAPDGSLIAFVNTVNGRSDLYIMKPDGSRLRRITTSGNVRMPDWSNF